MLFCNVFANLYFQDWVPQRYEKRKLYEAGLAEKRITFPKVEDHSSFITKLEEKFPKLAGCGGIELLRTSYTDRIKLELIAPPPMGYNAMHLAEESNLGQALCYIRPIQADLDTSSTGIPVGVIYFFLEQLLMSDRFNV